MEPGLRALALWFPINNRAAQCIKDERGRLPHFGNRLFRFEMCDVAEQGLRNRSGRERHSEPEEATTLTARTGVTHRYGAAPDCGI